MHAAQQQPQQQPAAEQAAPRTHTCISCHFPIAVYGRLMPCKHAFCLECATEMPKCVICCANISVVERVTQPLYVSALSLRACFTEEELQIDTRQMFRRIQQQVPKLTEALQQYHQKQQAAAQQQGGPAAAAGGGLPPALQQRPQLMQQQRSGQQQQQAQWQQQQAQQ